MSRPVRKVLVIKLGALGDFVLALAAAAKIREAHPEAHITLLTTPPYEALAKASPYFDAVETDGRPEDAASLRALIKRIRASRYDRVYDLQTSGRSSRYFYALWPFAPKWSGIAKGAAFRHKNPERDQMHTLERQADQLKVAGIWPDAPTAPGEAPAPDVSWMGETAIKIRPTRPFVILVPGGSAHRPGKRWPAERFNEVARYLTDAGYDLVVIGGPQETPLARIIARGAKGVRDLTGRTDFSQIAALGAKAALAIGNDTGPLHLITAAGAPTIALFSNASDPDLCAPRGHVTIIQSNNLDDLPAATVLVAANAMLPRKEKAPA
ncbi:glycosyltransferase family 9 protein [Caulobacter sp. NIBR2454]|uniref:glycosyltransferase family 9 protein n=1 Tax=Caulobacter sp. NIBR2454 TaxID=3015996 RepID=UPI0022B7346F|nr:glycosyltransferase family 9 protein [Caulobacter sp. NIBR2454]